MDEHDCLARNAGRKRPVHAADVQPHLLLKTISEENSKGSWHGWEMSLEGPITDANMYKSAKDFNASIEKGEVNVKHTQDGASSGNADNIPF